MKKILSLLLLMSLLLSGCQTGGKRQDERCAQELLQIPQYTETAVDLGTDLSPTGLSCLSGDRLYFLASRPMPAQSAEGPVSMAQSLFCTDLTENAQATPIWDYPETRDGDENFTAVVALFPGEDGSVWALESTTHYIFDLPKNFDESTHDKWEYYQFRGNSATFRQLSPEGKVLTSFEKTGLNDDYQTAVYADGYLLCAMENTVTVLDVDGTAIGSMTVPAYVTAMTALDGGVAIMTDFEAEGGSQLYRLDMGTFELSAGTGLPTSIYDPSGMTETLVYFTDRGNLFSWDLSKNQGEKHLDWQDLGRNRKHILDVYVTGQNTVAALYQQEAGESLQLLLLRQTDAAPMDDTLILGILFPNDSTMDLVLRFNSRNNGGKVRVADYAEYEVLGLQSRKMLQADLQAGRGPDLLFSADWSTPVTDLAPGVLRDLKPFMSQDGALVAQGLMEPVFSAMETADGKLLYLAPSFRLATTVGRADILSDQPRTVASAAELTKTLTSDGIAPVAPYVTQRMALEDHLSRLAGTYVQDEDFVLDPQAFLDGLDLTALFPQALDWDKYNKKGVQRDAFRVRLGNQLFLYSSYGTFSQLAEDLGAVGEDALLWGWPDVPGGHYFEITESWGMTTYCRQTDLAWRFLRQLLLDEVQDTLMLSGLPTNRTSFQRAARAAMQRGSTSQYLLGKDWVEVSDTLTQAQYDALVAAIEETTVLARPVEPALASAIYAAVEPYFSGRMTAEDAILAAQAAANDFLDPALTVQAQ